MATFSAHCVVAERPIGSCDDVIAVAQCRYEFGEFTGRWIGELNISYKNLLWIIKLFELEVSDRKSSLQMGISYPTVLKTFQIIRMAITATSADGELFLQGEIESDETYFGGRRKGKRGRA